MSGKIRPLAIAIIRDARGRYLLDQGFDRIKDQVMYRPLGGGIEFGESARVAVEREFMEEIGREIDAFRLLGSLENIFEFEGKPGHEIVMVYEARFKSSENYDGGEISENGRVVSRAVWKTLDEIEAEGRPLYPNGLRELLSRL